jgi:hypothetical protein
MADIPLDQSADNTDRELWRERKGDFYADSLFVTEHGGIGIHCGGYVFVKPIRGWYALASENTTLIARVRELEARTHADIVRLINDVSSLLAGRDFDMGEKRTLEARNAALTELLREASSIIARLEKDYAIEHTLYDGRPVEKWCDRIDALLAGR